MTASPSRNWGLIILVIIVCAIIIVALAYSQGKKDKETEYLVKAKQDRIKVIDSTISDQTGKSIDTLNKSVKSNEKHVKDNKDDVDKHKKYINRAKVVDTVYENNARLLENYK